MQPVGFRLTHLYYVDLLIRLTIVVHDRVFIRENPSLDSRTNGIVRTVFNFGKGGRGPRRRVQSETALKHGLLLLMLLIGQHSINVST